MAAVTGVLIVLALFALGAFVRLGLGARRVRWAFDWKAWAALGVACGLLLAGRWGGALVFGAIGLYLARPQAPPRSVGQPETPEMAAARALLGVSPGASAGAIRAAYRRKMAHAHPDVGGGADAAQALIRARDLLLKRS